MAVMLGGSGTLGTAVAPSEAARARLAAGEGRESADLRPDAESACSTDSGQSAAAGARQTAEDAVTGTTGIESRKHPKFSS